MAMHRRALAQMGMPLVLILLVAMAGTARAGNIAFVDMFRNVSETQTGNGNTLTPQGAFLSTSLTSVHANDFTAVQMTYPGPGSPVSLGQTSPTTWSFQTPFLADQATMDAAFPFGTYTFDATPADSTSFDYTADHYAAAQPFLTGTDFSDLQGMDPANPFTVHFSPFATDAAVNFQFLFFTIFDPVANAFVFNDGFLPNTTTSLTVPGGTLQANHPYIYEVDFSNRVLLSSPNAANDAQIGFERRTDGDFLTGAIPAAVPEPGTLLLALIGIAGLSGVGRRGAGSRAH